MFAEVARLARLTWQTLPATFEDGLRAATKPVPAGLKFSGAAFATATDTVRVSLRGGVCRQHGRCAVGKTASYAPTLPLGSNFVEPVLLPTFLQPLQLSARKRDVEFRARQCCQSRERLEVVANHDGSSRRIYRDQPSVEKCM